MCFLFLYYQDEFNREMRAGEQSSTFNFSPFFASRESLHFPEPPPPLLHCFQRSSVLVCRFQEIEGVATRTTQVAALR